MAELKSEPVGAVRPVSWLRILAVGRNPKRTVIRAVVLAVVCIGLFKFILLPMRVAGISMAPTYSDGSFNFVNRLAFAWREPARGDVVGVRLNPPSGWSPPHIAFLKRIIALPGETVSFAKGRVIINGKTLEESYEKWRCDWNLPPRTLGPDEYFVVGDNRTMPSQEHTFGRVKRDRIAGKALF